MELFSLPKYRSHRAANSTLVAGNRRSAGLLLSLVFALTVTGSYAQEDVISLIRGGGVAGHTTTYIVTRDGKVFRSKGIDPKRVPADFNETAKLGKWKTRRYFRKTGKLMEEYVFDHPGNMYTSLTLRQDANQRELVWGDPQYQVPEKVQSWFKKMQSRLGRLTFVEVQR